MENLQNESNSQILFGLAVEPEIIFSNHKNVFKPGIKKRQTALAKKITFLEKFLQKDEKIFCITTGCTPMTLLEQWLMGLWIFYIKRCLLVFTNKRILHIPTKTNYSYRNSISQILYADCQSISLKGRTLVVNYANKRKEKFYYTAGSENKKIKAFLGTVSYDNPQNASMQTRIHLCPRCTGQLINNEYICQGCGLEFKNKSESFRISVIFPGGGYFYTGHILLGIADALVETLLTISVILSLIDALKGVDDAFISTITLAIILALEKAITVHDSNKFIDEYIPLKNQPDVEMKKLRPDPTKMLRVSDTE